MNFITESDRIYLNDENGKLIAEVTFPVCDGVATIDHTFVDDSLRGQGVAGKLLELAIESIEKQGLKVTPVCSYARVWFDKHPEKSDLLK